MSGPLRLAASGLHLHGPGGALLERGAFGVAAGEVVALVGPPGAGKTALLKGLSGLLPAGLRFEGEVRYDGQAADAAMLDQWRGPRLAFIPQQAAAGLTPYRSLGSLFLETLALHGQPNQALALRRAAAALESWGIAAGERRLALTPRELPEAMRWRAALALWLVTNPTVVLADAPAAELDPTVRARLLARLAGWARAHGAALLLAGRPETGVVPVADRSLEMNAGRLAAAAAAPPVLAPRRHDGDGAPVLSVRDLTVSFPLGRRWGRAVRRLVAVDQVSFDVAEGGALALLGESGSGKAVLARAVARLIPAAAGRVAWHGQDLMAYDTETMRRARADIQVLLPPGGGVLDPSRPAQAQIAAAVTDLHPHVPAPQRGALAARALRQMGLPDRVAAKRRHELTAEEGALVSFARALVCGPRLLVCDEPVASLSSDARERFLVRLLQVAAEHRLTLLYATEDAAQALRIGQRVLVMMSGRVVETASAERLAAAARHPYTRALIAAAAGAPVGLQGDPPSPFLPPTGCTLRQRCPRAREYCGQEAPSLETIAPGHQVACHYWDLDEDPS